MLEVATIEYICHAAMQVDTLISHAFRRALGLPIANPITRIGAIVSIEGASDSIDADLLDCFENRESIMDVMAYA